MLQDKVNELIRFFQGASAIEGTGKFKVEELAKLINLTVPDALTGSTIRNATKGDKKGKNSFVISTLKSSWLGWLMPFLAKTKCYLVCWEIGDRLHCVHVCVTCFDGWPGPGCYLHGSYD